MNKTTPIPSEERLRILLANGCLDVVLDLIKQHDLKYRVDEQGNLVDALVGTDLWLKRFITVDPSTLQVKDDIRKLSKCEDEVLITGETGTGKELLARACIGNREGKSVAVNCAGLPETLMESELFGYVKGAFTGAAEGRHGMMKSADGGILFLDEVAELPLAMQGKLLRALQDKTVRRVGGTSEDSITCKFVFATNKNVAQMVKEGRFRQDLYARISTFELHVKPIRERKCDIEPIITSMPRGAEFYKEHWRGLHDGTLSLEHNVRSLQQHVKRWSVLGRV